MTMTMSMSMSMSMSTTTTTTTTTPGSAEGVVRPSIGRPIVRPASRRGWPTADLHPGVPTLRGLAAGESSGPHTAVQAQHRWRGGRPAPQCAPDFKNYQDKYFEHRHKNDNSPQASPRGFANMAKWFMTPNRMLSHGGQESTHASAVSSAVITTCT